MSQAAARLSPWCSLPWAIPPGAHRRPACGAPHHPWRGQVNPLEQENASARPPGVRRLLVLPFNLSANASQKQAVPVQFPTVVSPPPLAGKCLPFDFLPGTILYLEPVLSPEGSQLGAGAPSLSMASPLLPTTPCSLPSPPPFLRIENKPGKQDGRES